MVTAKIEPETHPSDGLNIYQIIDRISNEAGALAPEAKGGVPFAFRGIDSTVAHLSPFLRKYGVIVVPTVTQKVVSSAPSGNKVVTTTDLTVSFEFFAPDGTSIIATTGGLANDYADRSTAQAHSVAFRVALLETFFLPTHSPEPEQTGVEPEAPAQQTYAAPPADERHDKVKKARELIKGAAKVKGVEYLDKAVELKLPTGWADDLTELKKLHDAIAALPDAGGE